MCNVPPRTHTSCTRRWNLDRDSSKPQSRQATSAECAHPLSAISEQRSHVCRLTPLRLPCNSSTSREPAFECKESTFCEWCVSMRLVAQHPMQDDQGEDASSEDYCALLGFKVVCHCGGAITSDHSSLHSYMIVKPPYRANSIPEPSLARAQLNLTLNKIVATWVMMEPTRPRFCRSTIERCTEHGDAESISCAYCMVHELLFWRFVSIRFASVLLVLSSVRSSFGTFRL